MPPNVTLEELSRRVDTLERTLETLQERATQRETDWSEVRAKAFRIDDLLPEIRELRSLVNRGPVSTSSTIFEDSTLPKSLEPPTRIPTKEELATLIREVLATAANDPNLKKTLQRILFDQLENQLLALGVALPLRQSASQSGRRRTGGY